MGQEKTSPFLFNPQTNPLVKAILVISFFSNYNTSSLSLSLFALSLKEGKAFFFQMNIPPFESIAASWNSPKNIF